MRGLDVEVARAADRLGRSTRSIVANGISRAGVAPGERRLDVGAHVARRLDRHRHPAPDLGVEADGGQAGQVVERQRLEPDD